MGLLKANPQYQYYGNLSTPTVEQVIDRFHHIVSEEAF